MEFLSQLIAFFALNNVIPPEILPEDTNREGTYLQTLPAEPPNVYCLKWYSTSVSSIIAKESGVYRLQMIVRHVSNKEALLRISTLWKFLLSRPSLIEDISPDYWVIIDVTEGPIYVGPDEKGYHMYTLNFPIKSKIL